MTNLSLRVARTLSNPARAWCAALLAVGAATAACSQASGPTPVASAHASTIATPSSARPQHHYEPAFVEGTPGSECTLHPEGVSDPGEAIPVGIDEDGVARFHAVRPAAPSDVATLALDCVDPAGRAATYAVDLESAITFAPHPFDASRTDLEARPALTGDPLSFTQGELIHQGYGLRPDSKSNPAAFARWLAAAHVSAHKLRAAPGRAPKWPTGSSAAPPSS